MCVCVCVRPHVHRAHTCASIPLSCWLDSAYRAKCGCPALPGRCQPLKWVCIGLVFTSVFSEEVEVPAVTKKDCGCCSHRDSMDKDSVGVLFQPSAWQKIRGFLCFRVRLVGCGPGLELSQESTQELEGWHPAALLECVPPRALTFKFCGSKGLEGRISFYGC